MQNAGGEQGAEAAQQAPESKTRSKKQETEKGQQLPSKSEPSTHPRDQQADPFEHTGKVLNLLAAEVVTEEEAGRLLWS